MAAGSGAESGGTVFSAEEFSAAVSAVTSAFGDPTRRDIYLAVRSSAEGLTATEVAEIFELHPNVSRHHLEKLAGGGYLEISLSRHPTAGRPSKRYVASRLDMSLNFPPRRDELLATLLARALELLDPDAAGAMADQVGFEYGRAIAARITPSEHQRSVRAAMSMVADALTAHGFAAHTETKGRTLRIVSEQCPFGEAATLFPHVVCAVDKGMVRGMLAGLYGETAPELVESRPSGDEHCITTV